jgi:hypothetical protein
MFIYMVPLHVFFSEIMSFFCSFTWILPLFLNMGYTTLELYDNLFGGLARPISNHKVVSVTSNLPRKGLECWMSLASVIVLNICLSPSYTVSFRKRHQSMQLSVICCCPVISSNLLSFSQFLGLNSFVAVVEALFCLIFCLCSGFPQE